MKRGPGKFLLLAPFVFCTNEKQFTGCLYTKYPFWAGPGTIRATVTLKLRETRSRNPFTVMLFGAERQNQWKMPGHYSSNGKNWNNYTERTANGLTPAQIAFSTQ
jgi:hypothetical protein